MAPNAPTNNPQANADVLITKPIPPSLVALAIFVRAMQLDLNGRTIVLVPSHSLVRGLASR
ncbi:hypothetical protein CHELA40_13727 [Chelatococcus asaccharovorans]|nr:hypothetical protein CHELA40_13727 [Chelatococcus asaccharovorans]CAH1676045.1 hypothetical protein CHELA17_61898 [Chelatococcus asaccharovorans]